MLAIDPRETFQRCRHRLPSRSPSFRLGALGTWCAALALLLGAAASPSLAAFRCTSDLMGANDQPGQKDLTQFCIDPIGSGPFHFVVSWNWDDIAFSGNNSGDACALFDTDEDGNANFALCITVRGNPAVLDSVRRFSCANDRPDRCTNSVLLSAGASTCTAAAANGANPFDGGPDTVATCSISLDDFGGAGIANLLDACSYPSQQPNSDPSDCIITTGCTTAADCHDDNPCTADTCRNGFCTFPPAPQGTACRAAVGVCDPAEVCDGQSNLCPADQKSTAVCRPAAGACDVAESCDGVHDDCPADIFAPDSTLCRPAAGVCDVDDFCSGAAADCPADAKRTAECRSAAGPCDDAERCDGVHDDCPADDFEPATTLCRPAAGVCDLDDFCTGTAADCPADGKRTAECRPAAGPCDDAERCDGVHDDCPADDFKPATTLCRPAAGVCDADDFCTGTAADCPADAKRTAECRPAAAPSDVAERRDRVHDSCPAAAVVPGSACNDCASATFE